MTLEYSIAFTLLAFLVFGCILAAILRSIGTDQNKYDETSERLPEDERAVTHIHQGDDVARVG